jgi:hypothetical protein
MHLKSASQTRDDYRSRIVHRKETYRDSSPQPQSFPKVVAPGQPQNFTVLFRLDDDIQKAFRQFAELRVRYRHGDIEDMARTAIERVPIPVKQSCHSAVDGAIVCGGVLD